MALSLYEYDQATNTFVAISQGTQLNPVLTSHNGADGQTVVTRLFLRNGDLTKWYDGITLQPLPAALVGPGNVNGWSYKLLAGDGEPTTNEWSNRITGAALTSVADLDNASPRRHFFPEIGAVGVGDNNYFPFWVQVSVPRGTRSQVEVGVTLSLTATENNV